MISHIKTMIPGLGRSEGVIIYPEEWKNTRSISLVGRGTAAIGVIGVIGCNMYPLR
jgi:hypothetical protein